MMEMAANVTSSFCETTNSTLGNLTSTADCTPVDDYYDDVYTVGVDMWTAVMSTVNILICVGGLVGNALVIVVVVRYAKMKTVTNMYIVNLAVADLCFLVGIPFLVATTILRHWVFGFLLCRLFYILTSINWFTSVFTLTVMSADRLVSSR